jgi:hypothetical protein
MVLMMLVALQAAMSQQLTQIVGGAVINGGGASIRAGRVDHGNNG